MSSVVETIKQNTRQGVGLLAGITVMTGLGYAAPTFISDPDIAALNAYDTCGGHLLTAPQGGRLPEVCHGLVVYKDPTKTEKHQFQIDESMPADRYKLNTAVENNIYADLQNHRRQDAAQGLILGLIGAGGFLVGQYIKSRKLRR